MTLFQTFNQKHIHKTHWLQDDGTGKKNIPCSVLQKPHPSSLLVWILVRAAKCFCKMSLLLVLLFRSCERSSRSLDQDSPPKKRKQQHSFASSSQLLTAKRVPTSLQSKSSDIETTVFYIPGVDVKVCCGSFDMLHTAMCIFLWFKYSQGHAVDIYLFILSETYILRFLSVRWCYISTHFDV